MDFLTAAEAADLAPKAPPPLEKMTPKKFAQSVLRAFDRLGGEAWLIDQATADPRAFITLLQRVLPKTIDLDGANDLIIQLIDTFQGGQTSTSQTATGGSLTGILLDNGVELEINDTL
jgi:hypothetical protein